MTRRLIVFLALFLGGCGATTQSGADDDAHAETSRIVPEDYEEGPCGGFSDLTSSEPQLLLAGRLRVRAPGSSEDVPRSYDIMSAPHAIEMESRLFLDHEGARFVVFAVELFRTATDDLVAAARQDAGEGYRVAALDVAAPLEAAVAVPTELDLSDEAVDVAIAYAKTPDGLVQRVGFYVTPGAAETGGCRRLGLKYAESLVSGSRALPDDPGPRVLEGTIGIDLPARHRLVVQEGPDFTVYRVFPILPLGGAYGALGFYLGHHASFRPPGDAAQSAGELYGQPVEWHTWTTDEGVRRREAVVAAPGNAHTHVFMGADDDDVLAGLAEIAGSLREGVSASPLAACPPDATPPAYELDDELRAIPQLRTLASATELSVYRRTWDVPEVAATQAFFELIRHPRARDALLHLSLDGTTAGRLYGLAGLSLIDHEAFEQVVCAVRETLDARVTFRKACGTEERSVAELIEHAEGIVGQRHWSARQWRITLRGGTADLRGVGLGQQLLLGPSDANTIAEQGFIIGGEGFTPPLSASDTLAASLPPLAEDPAHPRLTSFNLYGGVCRTRSDGRVACWGSTPLSERRGATLLPAAVRWPRDIAVDLGLGCVLDANGHRTCFSLLDYPLRQRAEACPGAAVPTEPVLRRFDDGPFRELGQAGRVCGIRQDGALYCFASSNRYLPEWSELEGVGVGAAYRVPVEGEIAGIGDGHLFHAYAWMTDGRIYRWDIDEMPRVVGQIPGVERVMAGNDSGLEIATTSDGRVFARGARREQDGTLAYWGSPGHEEDPWEEVPALAGRQVFISDHHGCSLKDGRVSCWGQRTGYLPGSDGGFENAPVDVPALRGARSLLLGEWITCAQMPGGRHRCVGAHLDSASNGRVDEEARGPIDLRFDRIASGL